MRLTGRWGGYLGDAHLRAYPPKVILPERS